MLVSGPMDGFPDFIERFSIPTQYENWKPSMKVHNEYASIGSQLPWFLINIETALNLPFLLNFMMEKVNADGSITETYTATPVGVSKWAGYPALIVDLTSETATINGRIYLEPETEIILREQYYELGTSRKTIIESTVQDLKFNQPMSNM